MLERFGEVGLIDDAAFARAWVSSRHHGRGLAGRVLSQELRQRGVDPQTVTQAVEELDPNTEWRTARELVHRKARALSGVSPQVRTRRLVGLLARKGYPAGIAFAVVRAELAEAAELIPEDAGAADLDAQAHSR